MEAVCRSLRPVLFAIMLVMTLTIRTFGGSISGMCPSNCTCTTGGVKPDHRKLVVDCHEHPDVHDELLSAQLDSLLSSNLTYGRLKELRIISSPLTRVPRSVCRLTTLTALHLKNNRLTRLPDRCLGNLTALSLICASDNLVATLQDGVFDGLDKLATLKLGDNRISSIGLRVFDSSARLTNLTYVDLHDNRLATLEPWPYFVGVNERRSGKHAYVSVGGNNITSFTNKMGLRLRCGMKKMRLLLKVTDNQIRHISDWLRGRKIDLLAAVCMVFKSSILQLDGNPLICDCVDFIFYSILSYSTSRSGFLTGTLCNKPDSLFDRRVLSVPLDQFVCEVSDYCPHGCRCVHRPANSTLHVYCSNANLTVLPRQLPELPKSYTEYKLDFSKNRLLGRLEHRDYFVNASILDASNCGIRTVDSWTDVFTMKYAYLHGNRLASLPRSVATLNVSAKHITLFANPWTCSCDDRWMRDWISSMSNHLLNAEYVSCASPSRLHGKALLQTSDTELCFSPV